MGLYPDHHFEQYLFYFLTLETPSLEAEIKQLPKQYLTVKGNDVCKELLKELLVIEQTNDWATFINPTEEDSFDLETIISLGKTALLFFTNYFK